MSRSSPLAGQIATNEMTEAGRSGYCAQVDTDFALVQRLCGLV
jgi:hypothetical protein